MKVQSSTSQQTYTVVAEALDEKLVRKTNKNGFTKMSMGFVSQRMVAHKYATKTSPTQSKHLLRKLRVPSAASHDAVVFASRPMSPCGHLSHAPLRRRPCKSLAWWSPRGLDVTFRKRLGWQICFARAVPQSQHSAFCVPSQSAPHAEAPCRSARLMRKTARPSRGFLRTTSGPFEHICRALGSQSV